MRQHHTSSGFILVLVLLLVSLSMLMLNQLFDKSVVHWRYAHHMVDREKARALAWSGVQTAIAQLSQKPTSPQSQTQQQGASPQSAPNKPSVQAHLLKNLLPVINRWQIVELEEKRDGVSGTIRFCICSEEGKINVNELFDYKTNKFFGQGQQQGDVKKMLQLIFNGMKKFGIKDTNFLEEFEKFLKERQYKVLDVSELLAYKPFDQFKDKLFYVPSEQTKQSSGAERKQHSLYLTDIFTVWSTGKTIDPWLLSDSLSGLLGLKRAGEIDPKQHDQAVKEALKNFRPSMAWQNDWNKVMMPLYGKDFNGLPKDIIEFLSTKFEPATFSVISYGNVGQVMQKVVAIIQLEKAKDKQNEAPECKIKKVYWI